MSRTLASFRRAEVLPYVRDRLVERIRRRQDSVVTADDVQTVLDFVGFPQSQTRRLSITQEVLSGLDNTGAFTPSTRPAARGRLISEYTL